MGTIGDKKVDPRHIQIAEEEDERLSAVWDIWQAVASGVLLDEALDECTRDVIYQSLAKGAKVSDLAERWGITENNVYQIKHRGIKTAKKVTRAIFDMMCDKDIDFDEEAAQLYRKVSSMKPNGCKHVDKFMIELAKELLNGR